MILDQVIIYRRGLNVKRMHTIPHIRHYDNGNHSACAALIAVELCKLNDVTPEHELKILRYMLMHDIVEQFVGDAPADAKRIEPELKVILDIIELKWESKNLPMKPKDLDGLPAGICKASDIIELGMFCIEELNMGNKMVMHVLENVINYLGSYIHIKGVYQFLTHFQEEILNGS